MLEPNVQQKQRISGSDLYPFQSSATQEGLPTPRLIFPQT